MPVPVPRHSQIPAHPVIKHHQSGDVKQAKHSVFGHLTRSLPPAPTGPPPSFGSREDWISSLPSWRRNKSRQVWEEDTTEVPNFQQGLTVAENMTVIKGARAQACNSPMSVGIDLNPGVDIEDRASSEASEMCLQDAKGGWYRYGDMLRVRELKHESLSEKGAFTPVFEDMSPDPDNGREADSSPIGPVTPFADFVDRVVAAAPATVYETTLPPVPDYFPPELRYDLPSKWGGLEYGPPQLYRDSEQLRQQASEPASAPTATTAYRKLAEPLSEWIASYVWKACTTGMSLPSAYVQQLTSPPNEHSNRPPSYLAGSVRSLFLSTLLQPSAIFLAVWYIVRLPVYLGPVAFGVDQSKEAQFRTELLNDSLEGTEKKSLAKAPFKLIVLGCMLANKWLDDHTFSNKTWHTISSVPIHSLNKLESLALHLFSHDLSIEPKAWSKWLTHLMTYHMSLSSSSVPQPISRPSASPHSIVRKILEDLISVPGTSDVSHCSNEETCTLMNIAPLPVFLGLEERRRDKLQREEGMMELSVDVIEIDLDEDGPLREEYLPKRRVSRSGSVRSSSSQNIGKFGDGQIAEAQMTLPPPAKWSPAADEPILRERNRTSGQYTAVRPPLVPAIANYAVPAPYIQESDNMYPAWPAIAYMPAEYQTSRGYGHDASIAPHIQAACQAYQYACSTLHPFSRSRSHSHSLSYDHANAQSSNHIRSRSQTRLEYGEVRTSGEYCVPAPVDFQWTASNHYQYPAPYIHHFVPGSTMSYQPTWLRA